MKKKTLIILFLKKNIFSMICLLLSFFILAMGTVSYSKYVNSTSSSSNSTVGSFVVSASVDSVSGLSFTNTDFWSSSSVDSNEKIAMNVLRNLKFSVNNFKLDENGEKQVSDVKLQYDLSFSAPKVFAEKLAFQVFDDKNSPIIPQIVIDDLLKASGGTYDTSDSINYEEDNTSELSFSVKKENDLYVATSGSIIIKIEEYEDEVDQALVFRMWDTSPLTSEENPELEVEGGKILPPLEINFNQTVKFYRITIITGNFVLPAGEEKTDNYAIKLVTTSPILDDHLGSTIVKANKDSEGGTIGYSKIDEIYGGSGNSYYLQSIHEIYEEKEYDNPDFVGSSTKVEDGENIITGSVNLYKDGTISNNTSSQISETINKTEKVTSKKTENSEIIWNGFTITNQIDINNYKENAIAIGIKENEDTIYYICRLEVERTGSQEIEFIETEYEINPSSSLQKQKEITENFTVERLDGEDEIILLNTTRITKTTYDGNFTCSETTTTKKVERNYTQKGFIYRAYYVEAGVLKYLDETDEPLLKVTDEKNKTLTNKKFYLERMNVTSESHTDNVTSSTTSPSNTYNNITNITIESYDYIQKKIKRIYHYDEIVIDHVKWSEYDENDILNSIEINSNNKINFYENGIQKYWLAQCYSKNYPFYVDVIFEQTQ